MSLSATDSLNIIGYYGEMELPLAEKKVRIVMAEQLQGTVEKYYDTVRTILSDERTSKRKKDILLAAAVLSLKNAYLSIFDKYYLTYINAAGTGSGEPYSAVDAWKRRRAYDFALWITQTAQREPNLAFSESHAAAVTRTEVNAVCNLAAIDAAYRQGKRFKTWKTFGDLKVRPSHKAANGQRVPLDMPFTVGGYEMMFPNDNSLGAPAGEVVNCRCVLEFDDGNGLTNREERGIMGVGSDDVALEYQRYGRNKSTLVNKSYIEGGEYRRKFDKLTESKGVNKTLYDCAKKALKHRSGTLLEDMYWIDSTTGELLLSVEDSVQESVILYNSKIWSIVKSNSNLVALHTHPSSMPPSIADFNACFKNGYKFGVVACHDGKVYLYSSKQEVSEKLYDLIIGDYVSKGFSEFDAQIKALERLKQNYDIDFMEV